MNAKEFAEIGRRLFGSDWQSPLARRLKVHRTTLWRWLASGIPDDVALKVNTIWEAEKEKANRRAAVAVDDEVTEQMLDAGYDALFEEPRFPDGGQAAIKRALSLAYRAMRSAA